MIVPEAGGGSAGQTFLVGETLYLRALELGDAKHALAWRPSPFPIPAERAEELLREDVPRHRQESRTRLIACRIADDRPIGSVEYRHWSWRCVLVVPWVDIALGPAGEEIKAEIVRLVVPWLMLERHAMVVWAEIDDAGSQVMMASLHGLGMREAFRLRQAVLRHGRRHDLATYELLHPAWISRLGDPRAVDREPVVRGHPRLVCGAGETAVPVNAVMVGDRVFLRPYEVEDAATAALWSRRETETFFDNGRWFGSSLATEHSVRERAKNEPADAIVFAVAMRTGEELVGEVELDGIDWVHRTAETGSYIFQPRHRGSGLGTEAKRLLLDYAFNRLGLQMVRSFVWAPNTRSAAALRKQGYRDAGRLSWTSFSHGDFADTLVFDLLAEEWRAAQS